MGFRTEPLTAEDVDIGYRARAAGWKVLYEPEAVADNDAVEKMLAFRAQQRRWAQAVGRAGLDASGEILRSKWGLRAWLLEVTAPLAHLTIVLTLATLTSHSASTAALISGLVASFATLNTTALCSETNVAFSVMCGATITSK